MACFADDNKVFPINIEIKIKIYMSLKLMSMSKKFGIFGFGEDFICGKYIISVIDSIKTKTIFGTSSLWANVKKIR